MLTSNISSLPSTFLGLVPVMYFIPYNRSQSQIKTYAALWLLNDMARYLNTNV